MTLSLSQWKILTMYFVSACFGIFCALIYDIVRVFRKKRRIKRDAPIVFLEDILFFIFIGVSVSIIFFVYNYGRVRLFAFVSLFAGFAIYRISLSRFVLRLYSFIYDTASKIVAFAFSITLKPLSKMVSRAFSSVIRRIKARNAKNYEKKVYSKYIRASEKGYAKLPRS
ncbi:MAG: spore cortex biosynthesis protein YabQ [Clostridia bacterium]|nr:spore cortex biosynthesis protein YabQ [Clostridia bacterium]